MKQKAYIGIDMGGTAIKGGLVSPNGKLIRCHWIPVSAPRSKKKTVQEVIAFINVLARSTPKPGAIGLGWPATVNIALSGKEIVTIIKRKFGLPVFLENDASCFTLSEALIGSGKDFPVVLGITLGTGVGSGLVINKQIYQGRKSAPEFGHTTIDHQGPRCSCGNRGCLEAYLGKTGMAKMARRFHLKPADGLTLYQAARKGDRRALKLWNEFGKLLGIGLVNALNCFEPNVIVIGGGVSKAWPFFSASMRKEMDRRSFHNSCPIKLSRLENSGIIGATLMARQNFDKFRE